MRNNWQKLSKNRTDWYVILSPEFETILSQHENESPQVRKACGEAVCGFFERYLKDGLVALGTAGKN